MAKRLLCLLITAVIAGFCLQFPAYAQSGSDENTIDLSQDNKGLSFSNWSAEKRLDLAIQYFGDEIDYTQYIFSQDEIVYTIKSGNVNVIGELSDYWFYNEFIIEKDAALTWTSTAICNAPFLVISGDGEFNMTGGYIEDVMFQDITLGTISGGTVAIFTSNDSSIIISGGAINGAEGFNYSVNANDNSVVLVSDKAIVAENSIRARGNAVVVIYKEDTYEIIGIYEEFITGMESTAIVERIVQDGWSGISVNGRFFALSEVETEELETKDMYINPDTGVIINIIPLIVFGGLAAVAKKRTR